MWDTSDEIDSVPIFDGSKAEDSADEIDSVYVFDGIEVEDTSDESEIIVDSCIYIYAPLYTLSFVISPAR